MIKIKSDEKITNVFRIVSNTKKDTFCIGLKDLKEKLRKTERTVK